MIDVEIGFETYDGWGSCEGQGSTVPAALADALRNRGDQAIFEATTFSIERLSLDGVDAVQSLREQLTAADEALHSFASFGDTAAMAAVIRGCQTAREAKKEFELREAQIAVDMKELVEEAQELRCDEMKRLGQPMFAVLHPRKASTPSAD